MTSLNGVLLSPIKIINTSGGDVLHAMKKTDLGFYDFGEAYFSEIQSGAIKAWKRHKEITHRCRIGNRNKSSHAWLRAVAAAPWAIATSGMISAAISWAISSTGMISAAPWMIASSITATQLRSKRNDYHTANRIVANSAVWEHS